ncbi:UDP-glycosyltransferase 91B1 [Striga hermonthica]|uniref:Glycosyltransferase n=1 Tax=Striga hermonthica TaxID=68872 RepID=A0A9N7NTB4_STRHE|nr:UDP-glycosyltransferase 91B1 [Striga hermonthica]
MKNSKEIKIVMFPWLGYGHITPFLELGTKIAASRANVKVYLVSTLATLSSIEQKITTTAGRRSINLVPLLLPSSPGLPRSLHTTNGLPPNLMPSLKSALQSPEAMDGFSDILTDLSPDLIVYDFLQPWIPALARDHGIPAVQFVTCSCTMASVMCHYSKYPSGDRAYPFPEIQFRDYESAREVGKLLECANDPVEREMVFRGIEESCGVVLFKGFREIEAPYIDYAGSLVSKRFIPVGPLVQEPVGPVEKRDLDIFEWLDSKERKSTVFVSFGSEYFLSRDDMDEIALGLELSGVNFIWVVRFPKVEGEELAGALPGWFLDRVRATGRGNIVLGWAPQARILGHENVGGFVSHCGWNSVMESMTMGVPIVAMPMHLDQPVNARLVENVGVGVEVVREKDGRLLGEALAEAVRRVMVEDSGEVFRRAAAGMKARLAERKDEEIHEVVRELTALLDKE